MRWFGPTNRAVVLLLIGGCGSARVESEEPVPSETVNETTENRQAGTIGTLSSRNRTTGYLSAESISSVVRENRSAIRSCYEEGLQRDPSLGGRLIVRWAIRENGTADQVRLGSSTLNDAGVEECIIGQVEQWHFQEPDGGVVYVAYPFILGVAGDTD